MFQTSRLQTVMTNLNKGELRLAFVEANLLSVMTSVSLFLNNQNSKINKSNIQGDDRLVGSHA